MSAETRSFKEGAGYGVIAGTAFAVAQVISALVQGQSVETPFRMFAGIMLGDSAFNGTSAALAIFVGAVVLVALSAAFGFFYGVYNSALSSETRRSWNRQAMLGVLYGFMLWLVNFQFFARAHYPWFLEGPQGPQLAILTLFYGLPLGLMYVAAERRTRLVQSPFAYR